MPAHARRRHPGKVGACNAQSPWRATRWDLAQHIRVPAARVDQLVPLPGLIRQCSRAERLLDCRTPPGSEVLGRLPLARPIGQTASKSSLHQCGNKLTVFPHLISPDQNRMGIE